MRKWLGAIVVGFAISNSSVFAMGDIEAGKAKSASCVECHGEGGNSTEPLFPKIAGQGQAYLFKQLMDFASGAREGVFMAGIV